MCICGYKGYNETSDFIIASYNPDCMVEAMVYCYNTDGDDSNTANKAEKGEEFSFSAGNIMLVRTFLPEDMM